MGEKHAKQAQHNADKKAGKPVRQDKAFRKKSGKKKAARGKSSGKEKSVTINGSNQNLNGSGELKTSMEALEKPAKISKQAEHLTKSGVEGSVRTKAISQPVNVRAELFGAASQILAVASLILLCMILFAIVSKEAGISAVRAFGGLSSASQLEGIDAKLIGGALFLDILLPIAYGAGLALFAYAYNRSGMRPLVRLNAVLFIFAAGFDLVENLTILNSIGGDAPFAVHWFTGLKYGLLAIAAVLLSVVIHGAGRLVKIAQLLLRYLFPLLVAALLSGLLPQNVQPIVTIVFLAGLLILCLVAYEKSVSQSA